MDPEPTQPTAADPPAEPPAASTATDLLVQLREAGLSDEGLGKLCALKVRYARPGTADLDGLQARLTHVRGRVEQGRLVPGQD